MCMSKVWQVFQTWVIVTISQLGYLELHTLLLIYRLVSMCRPSPSWVCSCPNLAPGPHMEITNLEIMDAHLHRIEITFWREFLWETWKVYFSCHRRLNEVSGFEIIYYCLFKFIANWTEGIQVEMKIFEFPNLIFE